MKTKEKAVPEFATPAQVAAAKKDLENAKSKGDVADVWEEHVLKVGHRRLGRLLLGKDPERGKGAEAPAAKSRSSNTAKPRPAGRTTNATGPSAKQSRKKK